MAPNTEAAVVDTHALFRAGGLRFFLTVVWAVVAWWRPEVTYHLAPPLIAGVVPLFHAAEAVPPPSALQSSVVAGLGTALAAVVSALLRKVGWLAGPSLLPVGDAFAESIVFAVVGGIVGWAAAARRVSAP